MKRFLLEACVDSVTSAMAAVIGGADRLELCSNLIIGGTTPDLALFKEIRKYSNIPIRVLLRPRFGDFHYDFHESQIILENISMYRAAGADGIVIGSLNPDGTLNVSQMEKFIKQAGNMGVTLHRAFDMCRDSMDTMRIAKAIGVDTILTSGQAQTCMQGREVIRQLTETAGEDLTILAGAGVLPSVIRQMYETTGVTAYHMSGKTVRDSAMVFRRDSVNMGLPGFSEYEMWETSEEEIRKAKNELLLCWEQATKKFTKNE